MTTMIEAGASTSSKGTFGVIGSAERTQSRRIHDALR